MCCCLYSYTNMLSEVTWRLLVSLYVDGFMATDLMNSAVVLTMTFTLIDEKSKVWIVKKIIISLSEKIQVRCEVTENGNTRVQAAHYCAYMWFTLQQSSWLCWSFDQLQCSQEITFFFCFFLYFFKDWSEFQFK